jgi:DNA repair exonuclease SbcCD ATPase subunit
MKILYLKLKNFKGIFAGMKRTEIEIDFSITDKRFIMFLGKNGSGKSTIQSMLHPFPDSFDNRDTLILDGKEGYKEIHYQKGDDFYVIQHFYGRKNKSFMFKNGTENEHNLNGNGGIRTFVELCQKELGVTPDHFKLIRIGSGSDNFIDLNSSARKSFMGKFTPSIEEYQVHFKVVNDKYNATGKEIKYITDEIGKLDNEENVLREIDILSKTLKKNQAAASAVAAEMAGIQRERKEIEDSLSEFEEQLERREEVLKEQGESEAALEEIYERFPSRREMTKEVIEEKLEGLKAKLKTLEETLTALTIEKEKLQANKNNAISNRRAAEAEESKYSKSPVSSISNLKALLKEEKEKLETNLAKYKAIKEFSDKSVEALDAEEANASVNELNRLSNRINEAKHDLSGEENEELIHGYLFETSDEGLIAAIGNVTDELEGQREELKKGEKRLRKLQDDAIASEAVRKVTAMCKNTSCKVYILGQEELKKDTEADNQKIANDELKQSIIANETQLELLNLVRRHYKLFNSEIYMALEMHSVTATRPELWDLVKLGNGTEVGQICYNASSEELAQLFDFSRLVTKINLFRKITDSRTTIENIEQRMENLGNAEQMLEGIRKRVAKHTEEVTALKEEEAKLIEKIEEVEAERDQKEQIVELYETIHAHMITLLRTKKELKTLNKIYERNKENIEKKATFDKRIKDIQTRQIDADENVENVTDDLNKQKLKLERIKEYRERKDKLTATRDKLMIVRDSLDIKTGMPLYVLGAYLDDIKDSTNELMTMAFGESFFIDFVISDSEFSIPVYRDNVKYANDVLECSQGETALVKCSLSLGITSQAIKNNENKYSIICLDEIDAELDHEKRQQFISILERQMDKLNSQQCFMITHNDAFHAAELGLIVLKGANVDLSDDGFMANKDVIADFR